MRFILTSLMTHSMNVNMLNHGLATKSPFGTMPGGLAPSAPQTPVYLSDWNETFKNMF